MTQRSSRDDQLLQELNVSRETIEKLDVFAELLLKWNQKINLISPKTEGDIWQRHILDSLQLFPLIKDISTKIGDIGSGAGFPGLILAIAGCSDVTMIESDQRKCAFMREANRITGAGARIEARRIEESEEISVDLVTSRALAPVTKLLDLASVIATEKTQCLFLKGQHLDDELTEAHKKWFISAHRVPSKTDPAGIILHIGAFRHVADRS